MEDKLFWYLRKVISKRENLYFVNCEQKMEPQWGGWLEKWFDYDGIVSLGVGRCSLAPDSGLTSLSGRHDKLLHFKLGWELAPKFNSKHPRKLTRLSKKTSSSQTGERITGGRHLPCTNKCLSSYSKSQYDKSFPKMTTSGWVSCFRILQSMALFHFLAQLLLVGF